MRIFFLYYLGVHSGVTGTIRDVAVLNGHATRYSSCFWVANAQFSLETCNLVKRKVSRILLVFWPMMITAHQS